MLRLSPANVATPATAFTVVVPLSVDVPGFAPIAMLTEPVNAVVSAFTALRASTVIDGVILAPAAYVAPG